MTVLAARQIVKNQGRAAKTVNSRYLNELGWLVGWK